MPAGYTTFRTPMPQRVVRPDPTNSHPRSVVRTAPCAHRRPGVAYAQVGIVGFDGPIELQALRLYGLPEAAPAVLNGTPLLSGALSGSGRREFAAEVSWDLPSLAAGGECQRGCRAGLVMGSPILCWRDEAARWLVRLPQCSRRRRCGARRPRRAARGCGRLRLVCFAAQPHHRCCAPWPRGRQVRTREQAHQLNQKAGSGSQRRRCFRARG